LNGGDETYIHAIGTNFRHSLKFCKAHPFEVNAIKRRVCGYISDKKSVYLSMDFVAIDFETAHMHHICAVGIVSVFGGTISDEYYTLVQPPKNYFNYYTTKVHGITPKDTVHAPTFEQVYNQIKQRIGGRIVVAHNETFDRRVLMKTMSDYDIAYSDLDIADKWECTCKIYRKKGFKPASLSACCQQMGIALDHHQALSDARACALLYLKK